MAVETYEVEVWVCIDEDKCYAVGTDAAEAVEAHDDTHGTRARGAATRMVRIVLTGTVPCAIELTATVPAEPAAGVLTVAGE